jgi:ABC-type antimicrobial peptide transport system ATPase subunit
MRGTIQRDYVQNVNLPSQTPVGKMMDIIGWEPREKAILMHQKGMEKRKLPMPSF